MIRGYMEAMMELAHGLAATQDELARGMTRPRAASTQQPAAKAVEIGGDYILGIWRDALDVESIRLYPLIKR